MENNWRRFTKTFVISSLALFLSIFISLVIIDPLNFIKFSPKFERIFISPYHDGGNPLIDRYAANHFSKSEKFDSAMFGSSVSYILETGKFNDAFEANFLNLSMRAALPYEQMVIMNNFLKYHPTPKMMMFFITNPWCTDENGVNALRDPLGPIPEEDFPTWLFDENSFNELLHIFNLNNLNYAKTQFLHITAIKKKEPTVYDIYGSSQPPTANHEKPKDEVIKALYGNNGKSERPALKDFNKADFDTALKQRDFGRIKLLRKNVFDKIPKDTIKAFIFLPRHIYSQPQYGSLGYAKFEACKSTFLENFKNVPNTHFVDFLIDSKLTREDNNFWDPDHGNYTMMRKIPEYIVDAIKSGQPEAGYYNYLNK